jgi:copper homeostasis protein
VGSERGYTDLHANVMSSSNIFFNNNNNNNNHTVGLTKQKLPIIEVCCDSYVSVVNAINGGAKRIELCSALDVEGLTPSYGLLTRACHIAAIHSVPINVLIRTRSGDFTYTNEEIDMMLDDVRIAKRCGASGIVFGALTSDFKIDLKTTSEFVTLAHSLNMSFTFHRAFDLCVDIMTSLLRLTQLNVDRLLTSGAASTAQGGTSAICRCVEKVKEERSNLIVMAGGGITKDNILMIIRSTGVEEVHGSFKVEIDSIAEPSLRKPVVSNLNGALPSSSPNRRSGQHVASTNDTAINQKRFLTSTEKVIQAMEAIGYANFTRNINKNINADRKSFISATFQTGTTNNVEFILLRNREHLVQKREKELQRLCYAVENISHKNSSANKNELEKVRRENVKIHQENLRLLQAITSSAKQYNYLKHQNREYEIINNELRRNNVTKNRVQVRDGNDSDESKQLHQNSHLNDNDNMPATYNVMDFNNLLQIQGELRSEIHSLRLLKNNLDKKCRNYEKTLSSLHINKAGINELEESKLMQRTRNKHLLEINNLQENEKKLKKENLKFLKKVNEIKQILRAKDKEHLQQIKSKQDDLDKKDLKIKELIKKLKKEKSMTKYLNTRIEEASLLRHELQKEHENKILQSNSVIGQLQSKVTQLKFSNSINNDYTNDSGNDISNVEDDKSEVNNTISLESNASNFDDIGHESAQFTHNNTDDQGEEGESRGDIVQHELYLKSQLETVRAKTKQLVLQAKSLVDLEPAMEIIANENKDGKQRPNESLDNIDRDNNNGGNIKSSSSKRRQRRKNTRKKNKK